MLVRRLLVGALLLLGAAACANDSDSASEAPTIAEAGDVATDGAGAGAEDAPSATLPVVDEPARSIIYTASMVVRTDDVAGATEQAIAVNERHGGVLFNQELALDEPARATLTLKVPPDELLAVLDELGDLGEVSNRSQQAQDVTAQVVDVESRIASAEASIVRLRDLLDKATSVRAIADLEGELAEREATLESLKATQRTLSEQVAQATITVFLTEPTDESVVRKLPGVGDALASGASAFWTAIRAILIAIAWSLPFLLVGLVVVLVVRRLRTRRSAAGTGQGPTDADDAQGGQLPPPSG
jgi:Domain of unknown function (DUF4349)